MSERLCLLCCRNFLPEMEAAIAAEGWQDVGIADFPARCGQPPLAWEELQPGCGEGCAQAVVFGRACLQGLDTPPAGWPPIQLLAQGECFHLVAGPALVAEAMARGAYLVTPGWLRDWRENLRRLGFGEGSAAEFFKDFAREIVLLDTGVVADSASMLADLARAVGLPASRIAVGLDHVRPTLARLVAEWRLESERRQRKSEQREMARERADQLAAMDFLGRLPLLKDEAETVAAIEQMFHMLFAPEKFHYVRFEAGVASGLEGLAPEMSRQVAALAGAWAWTESGAGFLLRIDRGGEILGIAIADHFAFPAFRARYLNFALSVVGVCALAIENARTYRRIKAAEKALRRSEHSLKIAQAVAHVGHWEWEANSDNMQWSDETYRILGREPRALAPSRHNFLAAIHPDDRARVADHINPANKAGSFDIEYRIVRPDARVRIVHSLGERMPLDEDWQSGFIATIQDVTESGPGEEVLGVIQDITERKELELRLAEEAHTDALTGCANRRHFLESARTELLRLLRYGGELSLLMLDIDHFKAVNDRHGHAVGDLALQTLVRVCRTCLREEDVIGRLGGEEFAIMLPETGSDKAIEVAERLRREVAAAEIPCGQEPTLRITASIGVATRAPGENCVDTILKAADQALYLAKAGGRNRVVAAAGIARAAGQA